MIVTAMGGGIAVLHMRAAAVPAPDPVPPLAVSAMPVEIEPNYVVSTSFVGRVEPARETALAFENGGFVSEVLVEEGAHVSQGAVIARLDTDLLQARRLGLVARRREAEAQRDLATRTSERQQSLNEQGFASTQRFDEARLSVASLDARIDSIDAEIAALDIDIAKATLTAPFGGTVARRLVDEGAVVAAGTAVAELLETDRLQARIGLPESQAQHLNPGDRAKIAVAGVEVDARLVSLRPDLDAGTRTLEALFDLDAGLPLVSGAIAELKLGRTVETPGAWLPLSALKEDASGLWMLTILEPADEGHRVARAAVEVLHLADNKAFVRGTFGVETLVLPDGADRVVPGQSVVVAGR